MTSFGREELLAEAGVGEQFLRELQEFGIVVAEAPRRPRGLRRDRPRDRPRRRRALPVRRRRAQPARLQDLRRSRGGAARAAAERPAALPQPGAAQGGGREPREPRRGLRPPQAPAPGPRPAPAEVGRRVGQRPRANAARVANAADRGRLRAASGTWSPTRTTCRAGGRRPKRVEDVRGEPGDGRSGPRVLETERGTGVRADFRCTEAERGRALRVGAADRGHAVRARPARGAGWRSGCGPRAGDRGDADQRGVPARALAAGLDDDAGRRARAARRGAGRDRAGARRMSPRTSRDPWAARGSAGEVVGVGRPREADPARRPRAGDAARRARRRPSRRAGSSSMRSRCPSRERCPTAIADAVDAGERAHRRTSSACAASAGQRLPGPDPAAKRAPSSTRPDAVVMPGEPGAGRRACSRSARARGSPWSRSAAAPASSAGSSRCARRARAGDRARPAAAARGRGRPGLADRDARARAARARGRGRRCGAHGLTIGHFPQSFEYATIGGFAATRSAGQASAGYGRFDELVTSLAMATPVGELRTLATPHTAAGPVAARARARLRGRARARSPRSRSASARRPASAATRPGSPPTSPPAARSSARWPRRTRSPTSPGSPTRPRPG